MLSSAPGNNRMISSSSLATLWDVTSEGTKIFHKTIVKTHKLNSLLRSSYLCLDVSYSFPGCLFPLTFYVKNFFVMHSNSFSYWHVPKFLLWSQGSQLHLNEWRSLNGTSRFCRWRHGAVSLGSLPLPRSIRPFKTTDAGLGYPRG